MELHEQLEQAQDRLRRATETIEGLKERVQCLENEAETAKEQAKRQMQNQWDDLFQTITNKDALLQSERKSHLDHLMTLQEDKIKCAEKIAHLVATNEILDKRIEEAEHRLAHAASDLEELKKNLQAAQAARSLLQDENQELKQTNAIFMNTMGQAQDEPSEASPHHASSIGRIVEDELDRLRHERRNLYEQNRELQAKIVDMTQTLSTLEDSGVELKGNLANELVSASICPEFVSAEELKIELRRVRTLLERQAVYLNELVKRVIQVNPELLEDIHRRNEAWGHL